MNIYYYYFTNLVNKLQGEPKNRTFAFFGEKFSKITYKGYFHAIFEKKIWKFFAKKLKSMGFFWLVLYW